MPSRRGLAERWCNFNAGGQGMIVEAKGRLRNVSKQSKGTKVTSAARERLLLRHFSAGTGLPGGTWNSRRGASNPSSYCRERRRKHGLCSKSFLRLAADLAPRRSRPGQRLGCAEPALCLYPTATWVLFATGQRALLLRGCETPVPEDRHSMGAWSAHDPD